MNRLACPDDSKSAIPVFESSASTIPANHFQPPLVQCDPSPVAAQGGDFALLAGGVALGFACGVDASILLYAIAGQETKFLAMGCGLILAVLILAHLLAIRHLRALNRPESSIRSLDL